MQFKEAVVFVVDQVLTINYHRARLDYRNDAPMRRRFHHKVTTIDVDMRINTIRSLELMII